VFGTNVGYDPIRDFAPTSTISLVPIALVVHPSLPARTAKEFIALAKARPGQLLMASAGAGSNTHLTGELFQVVAGVKFTHVPYKGGGPAVIDLVAGQTQLMFDQVTTSTPHVKAGKLRAIAVAFPEALAGAAGRAHDGGIRVKRLRSRHRHRDIPARRDRRRRSSTASTPG
jgi:tripartite-type tricarboxylate transporter receptor subunit TctC